MLNYEIWWTDSYHDEIIGHARTLSNAILIVESLIKFVDNPDIKIGYRTTYRNEYDSSNLTDDDSI